MTKTRELWEWDCPHKPWAHTPTPSEVVISPQDTSGNVMTWLTKTETNEIFLFTINIAFLNTECFFKCPQPTFRRPRCPATSDCCDGNSVSSTAASYAEQVTPYLLTVTELSLALVMCRTFL